MLRLGRNSLVGLTVVALVFSTIVWGLAGKPWPGNGGERTITIAVRDASTFAKFDRDVRIGGVNLGRIGKITRRGEFAAVTLHLDRDAPPVHTDATAEVRPHTLFDGNSFISLNPGSPDAPLLGERVLPAARTRNYVTVDKALRVADGPTRASLAALTRDAHLALTPDAVRGLRTTFKRAPALTASLALAARAARGLAGTELTGAVRGFARTVDGLANARQDLGPTLVGTRQSLAAVNTGGGRPLAAVIAALPGAAGSADRAGRTIATVADDLRSLSRRLVPVMAALRPALSELDPVLIQAKAVLSASPPFLEAVERALKAAGAAREPVIQLSRQLARGLPLLKDTVIPALETKSEHGVPNYEQLAYAISGGAGTLGMHQAPEQGDLGSGHLWRVLARGLTGVGTLPGCATFGAGALAQAIEKAGVCQP